jgi:hypothetical protein
MSNSDISRQTLSMPALGRYFDLGTFYDAVRDTTIPGKQNKSISFTAPLKLTNRRII